MGTNLLPSELLSKYEIYEYKHACAILKEDFPKEWDEIINVLKNFKLLKSHIVEPGGSKSKISASIDSKLFKFGWEERIIDTKVIVDEIERMNPKHKVDCFKNQIALEIEWNNKDPFFDRDLNNFRILYEHKAISVGVIITRSDELQDIFDELKRGSSYGASTTHMSKLIPRIEGGGSGGCPILVFGITKRLYCEDCE